MRRWMLMTTMVAVATVGSAVAGGVATGDAAPAFTLKDTQGKEHSLSDYKGRHVVLEWTNYECPFVRKHYDSKNMQALQKKYAGEGITWLSICSSAPGNQGHMKAADAGKAMADRDATPAAYLLDESGKVGQAYGAKTTPHMFVIGPDGKVVYQGAIDSIRSASPDDVAKADNYVAACLDACLTGKPVAQGSTKPYGCSVKY